jgi:hypothetical protein
MHIFSAVPGSPQQCRAVTRVKCRAEGRGVLLAMLAMLATGCRTPETNILNYPVASGGTLMQHVSRQSPSVILLLAPADIVVCGNHISRWMEWDRQNPGRLSIVLTRAPSEVDRRQLLLFRIKPDVVLGTSQRYARVPTPYEYLVAEGRIVLSQQVPVGSPVSPLLEAFEKGQVAALLRSGARHVR